VASRRGSFAVYAAQDDNIFWDVIHSGSSDLFAEKDLRELAEMSALVSGWHDHDRFIPLDEWLSIAREHALKLPAGDPQ